MLIGLFYGGVLSWILEVIDVIGISVAVEDWVWFEVVVGWCIMGFGYVVYCIVDFCSELLRGVVLGFGGFVVEWVIGIEVEVVCMLWVLKLDCGFYVNVELYVVVVMEVCGLVCLMFIFIFVISWMVSWCVYVFE